MKCQLVSGPAVDFAPDRVWPAATNDAADLLHAQEMERRRIAREIHDGTAQQLTALRFILAGLGHESRKSEIESRVAEAQAILGELVDEIRSLSYLLHPPANDGEGAIKSLARLVAGYSERIGLAVRLVPDAGEEMVAPHLRLPLLRIAQEALSNIHRHAEASSAEVTLAARGRKLVLTIEDDGRGIDFDRLSSGELAGVGIESMRARAAEAGGTLRYVRIKVGTRLEALFPRSLYDGRPRVRESGNHLGGLPKSPDGTIPSPRHSV